MKKIFLLAVLISVFCLPALSMANLFTAEMISATVISNECDEPAEIEVKFKRSGCQVSEWPLNRKIGSGSWEFLANVQRSYSENCYWSQFHQCTHCTDYFEYTDTVDMDYGYIYYLAEDTYDDIYVSVYLTCVEEEPEPDPEN